MPPLSFLFAGACLVASVTTAHARPPTVATIPAPLAVDRPLGDTPSGVAELKFRDLFKLPVGPKGLEPAAKARRLDGKRVRIVGYVVHQQPPLVGGFLLSPLPVEADDEDESLADDIPASAIFVSLPTHGDFVAPIFPGLIQVTGRLKLGAREIPGGGRVAAARVQLDPDIESALVAATSHAPGT